jgi:hypothetical protein
MSLLRGETLLHRTIALGHMRETAVSRKSQGEGGAEIKMFALNQSSARVSMFRIHGSFSSVSARELLG